MIKFQKFFFLLFFNFITVSSFAVSDSFDCAPKEGLVAKIVAIYDNSLTRLQSLFKPQLPLGEKFETGARKIILPEWGAAEITPKEMLPKFVGESGVKYFNSKEAMECELHFGNDGKLYDSKGRLFDSKDALELDKFGQKRKFSREGFAIVVMDTKGRIYAHKRPHVGLIQHSSFVAGAPVGFAGEIEVIHGIVNKITNGSGHYLPGQEEMEQFVDRLRLGMTNNDFKYLEKIIVKK